MGSFTVLLCLSVCILIINISDCTDHVFPKRYDMTLEVINETNYKGSIDIEVQAAQNSKFIKIDVDTKYLTIDKTVKIRQKDTGSVIEARACIAGKGSIFRIKLLKSMVAGKRYIISIPNFSGKVTDGEQENGGGIYLDTSENNAGYFMWTTLFETSYARRVFPCFDQPRLKAIFQLTIKHKPNIQVFSNTLVENTESTSDLQHTTFKPTPLMSTYLFAFGIARGATTASKKLTKTMNKNVNVEFVCNPDIPCTTLMKEYYAVIDSTIEHMEDMTDFAYPLTKLGFAFSDGYFSYIGGMENMGMIAMNGRRDMSTVIHEVVHQWIGNMVTNNIWNYVCLQEGLTSYTTHMLDKDSEKIEWKRSGMMIDTDGKAVISNITSLEDVSVLRCYEKPVVIFHMVQAHFGKEPFGYDLIASFFNTWLATGAYKTYTMDEVQKLFNGIEPGSGDIVESYYTTPAYPIVVVSLQKGQLSLLQINIRGNLSNPAFKIPYKYMDNLGNTHKDVLLKTNTTITISNDADLRIGWYIFNDNTDSWWGAQVYTSQFYKGLVQCLDENLLDCPDQSKIIDLFNDLYYAPKGSPFYPLPNDRDLKTWREIYNNVKSKNFEHDLVNAVMGLKQICDGLEMSGAPLKITLP